MSVVAIIVIAVVVVALLVGLFMLLPAMRERARLKARERELGQRRERAASEQREAAEQHVGRAEAAEQRARIAAEEARRERAEADLRQERAGLHERGLADEELIEDHEREHFAGTSAVSDDGELGHGAAGRDGGAVRPEEPVETER
jgi:FtsZ-interacting cell division protein ZipA